MTELLQDSKFWNEKMLDNPRYIPLAPDEWRSECGNYLYSPSDFDVELWGRGTVRIESHIVEIGHPIKVYVTGRKPQLKRGSYRIRVKIEFLRDGEESQFSSGWLWLPEDYNLR